MLCFFCQDLFQTNIIFVLTKNNNENSPYLESNFYYIFQQVWLIVKLDKTNLNHFYYYLSTTSVTFSSRMAEESTSATANTITRESVGTGEFNYSHRKYARHILTVNIIPISPEGEVEKESDSEITFFRKDIVDILLHNNDHMIITFQYKIWDVK